MKKNNRILLLSMALFSLSSLNVMAQNNNVIDEIVWIVGDEAIYKSEVEDARVQAQMRGSRWEGDPYCIIPEELAIRKLYLNQADIDSIYASSSEVNEQIDYTLEVLSNDLGSLEKVEEYYGMPASRIRERMYDAVSSDIISRKMQNAITEKVKVTPAEVRRYFRDAPSDEVPYVYEQVEVQIITREPEIPQEEIDQIKAELRDFSERVQSGQSQFSTLARFYSDDEVSARNGGELGFVGKGQVVPEFAAVAFSLTDPQKVSKIVETEYGYHIIQLIEKRGDRVNVRHILRKPRVPESSINDCLMQLDTIADRIRSGELSFDVAAQTLSSDKNTKNNRGLMMYQPENENTSISKFEMQQLPREVARVVNGMHINEVSEPFTMLNSQGKTVCAIVKLKTRVEGHKANMADDYQILQEIVLAKKKEEVLRKWIEEKQRTTYVKIFDGWNNCEFRYPGWIIQ